MIANLAVGNLAFGNLAVGTVATVVVIGGMGCHGRYDDSELKAIVPVVDAACDPDGVELAYDTEYFSSEGDFLLTAVEVRDLDAACLGTRVHVEIGGIAGTLAEGSSPVDDDRVRVLWEPVSEVMGADGETFTSSYLDVLADDVRAVTVTILREPG